MIEDSLGGKNQGWIVVNNSKLINSKNINNSNYWFYRWRNVHGLIQFEVDDYDYFIIVIILFIFILFKIFKFYLSPS